MSNVKNSPGTGAILAETKFEVETTRHTKTTTLVKFSLWLIIRIDTKQAYA